jgi:hypothetical protein
MPRRAREGGEEELPTGLLKGSILSPLTEYQLEYSEDSLYWRKPSPRLKLMLR